MNNLHFRPGSAGDNPERPGRRSPAPPDEGSTLRLIAGTVLVITGVALALVGFVYLVSVLDSGGYGTSSMRNALVVLGASGASLAAGVATLIWDVAKRYEKR